MEGREWSWVIKSRLLIFVGFSFYLFFFMLIKKMSFPAWGIFFVCLTCLSPHIFIFFVFSSSSVHKSEGLLGIFCQSFLCSFQSSFSSFSHTHTCVDINIFLSLSTRCVLPSQNEKLRVWWFLSLSFHLIDFFQGGSLITGCRDQCETIPTNGRGFVGFAIHLVVWTPLLILTPGHVGISQVVQKSLRNNKQKAKGGRKNKQTWI